MAEATPSNVTPISADSRLSDEQKRAELRARIEAGEKRNAERSFADQAKDAADTAIAFTKKHPFAVVGGAVAVGLAIGAMTRPGRRLGKRGGALATVAFDSALAYGAKFLTQALDAADAAGERLGDLGDTAGATARSFSRQAAGTLEDAGGTLREASRKALDQGVRTAESVRKRLTH